MIEYQKISTPFGDCILAEKLYAWQEGYIRKIVFLEFIENEGILPIINSIKKKYNNEDVINISDKDIYHNRHIFAFTELFDTDKIGWDSLEVEGTSFQLKVWRTLFDVPFGEIISYSELAKRSGYHKAVRAVATVVASNPISLIIPCHRIVRNEALIGGRCAKSSGGIKYYGNYRWGKDVKSGLIEWEMLK